MQAELFQKPYPSYILNSSKISFASKIGLAPSEINSLHPFDNIELIFPGTAKTFRFSCNAILAVIKLPLCLLASTTSNDWHNPEIILFRAGK